MEIHRTSIAHLIPCRKLSYVHTFLPKLNHLTPVYLAGVPVGLDFELVSVLVIPDEDIKGLLSYQIREYMRDIQENVSAAFTQELIPLILGTEEVLRLTAEQFAEGEPSPIPHFIFNKGENKEKAERFFFVFEEGEPPTYYEFETLDMRN